MKFKELGPLPDATDGNIQVVRLGERKIDLTRNYKE